MVTHPPPRYYGCGLVVPECLAACRVLDLGSGSGRDCYLLSQLVGERGHVTGIDMTQGQVGCGDNPWACFVPSPCPPPPMFVPFLLPGGGGEEAHRVSHGEVWLPKAQRGLPPGLHGEAG